MGGIQEAWGRRDSLGEVRGGDGWKVGRRGWGDRRPSKGGQGGQARGAAVGGDGAREPVLLFADAVEHVTCGERGEVSV